MLKGPKLKNEQSFAQFRENITIKSKDQSFNALALPLQDFFPFSTKTIPIEKQKNSAKKIDNGNIADGIIVKKNPKFLEESKKKKCIFKEINRLKMATKAIKQMRKNSSFYLFSQMRPINFQIIADPIYNPNDIKNSKFKVFSFFLFSFFNTLIFIFF